MEAASHGFIHTDLIGQMYMCYLLPRTANLLLTRLEKSNSTGGTPIFGMVSSLPAKDAVSLVVSELHPPQFCPTFRS